jgi:hypothetical protein
VIHTAPAQTDYDDVHTVICADNALCAGCDSERGGEESAAIGWHLEVLLATAGGNITAAAVC